MMAEPKQDLPPIAEFEPPEGDLGVGIARAVALLGAGLTSNPAMVSALVGQFAQQDEAQHRAALQEHQLKIQAAQEARLRKALEVDLFQAETSRIQAQTAQQREVRLSVAEPGAGDESVRTALNDFRTDLKDISGRVKDVNVLSLVRAYMTSPGFRIASLTGESTSESLQKFIQDVRAVPGLGELSEDQAAAIKSEVDSRAFARALQISDPQARARFIEAAPFMMPTFAELAVEQALTGQEVNEELATGFLNDFATKATTLAVQGQDITPQEFGALYHVIQAAPKEIRESLMRILSDAVEVAVDKIGAEVPFEDETERNEFRDTFAQAFLDALMDGSMIDTTILLPARIRQEAAKLRQENERRSTVSQDPRKRQKELEKRFPALRQRR